MSKFHGCNLIFSQPIKARLLPDDKLRLKKLENLGVPPLAGYGVTAIGILGTNLNSISPDIINSAIIYSAFPAIGAFLLRLQKRYE